MYTYICIYIYICIRGKCQETRGRRKDTTHIQVMMMILIMMIMLVEERGSAPKRGRHFTIFVSAEFYLKSGSLMA